MMMDISIVLAIEIVIMITIIMILLIQIKNLLFNKINKFPLSAIG